MKRPRALKYAFSIILLSVVLSVVYTIVGVPRLPLSHQLVVYLLLALTLAMAAALYKGYRRAYPITFWLLIALLVHGALVGGLYYSASVLNAIAVLFLSRGSVKEYLQGSRIERAIRKLRARA